MSNMSNSLGEGGGGGRHGDKFIDTGYGTHEGQGNVPTGVQYEKGTGYDEHGQVATSFGKWPVSYDPVTGMAADNVTTGYDFPVGPGGPDAGGGLADVFAVAPDHSTTADNTPEMQRQLQEFLEAHRHQLQGQPATPQGQAGQEVHQEHAQSEDQAQQAESGMQAGEETGQGVAERLDAGAYLPQHPELTGRDVESWHDRRNRKDDV